MYLNISDKNLFLKGIKKELIKEEREFGDKLEYFWVAKYLFLNQEKVVGKESNKHDSFNLVLNYGNDTIELYTNGYFSKIIKNVDYDAKDINRIINLDEKEYNKEVNELINEIDNQIIVAGKMIWSYVYTINDIKKRSNEELSKKELKAMFDELRKEYEFTLEKDFKIILDAKKAELKSDLEELTLEELAKKEYKNIYAQKDTFLSDLELRLNESEEKASDKQIWFINKLLENKGIKLVLKENELSKELASEIISNLKYGQLI